MTSFDLSVRFFLQLAFILGVCRLVGMLAQRVGQSQVVSEMHARQQQAEQRRPHQHEWVYGRERARAASAAAHPA